MSSLLLGFCFVIGYLSGSVPYGLLLGKMAGIGDIRHAGSGNIGATNALRVGGKKLGLLTLLLDALKGIVPVLIAGQIHMDYALAAAIGAFLGHLFPVWLGFRGGKGVAVALGILLALSWPVGVLLMAIWLAVAVTTRFSSAAALAAFGLSPLVAFLVTQDVKLTAVTTFIAVIIWLKHHENIRRLLAGTESKINLGRKA